MRTVSVWTLVVHTYVVARRQMRRPARRFSRNAEGREIGNRWLVCASCNFKTETRHTPVDPVAYDRARTHQHVEHRPRSTCCDGTDAAGECTRVWGARTLQGSWRPGTWNTGGLPLDLNRVLWPQPISRALRIRAVRTAKSDKDGSHDPQRPIFESTPVLSWARASSREDMLTDSSLTGFRVTPGRGVD